MATASGKNVPKYGAQHKMPQPKMCSKISAEMLTKQNIIFSAIYFTLALLRISQIYCCN